MAPLHQVKEKAEAWAEGAERRAASLRTTLHRHGQQAMHQVQRRLGQAARQLQGTALGQRLEAIPWQRHADVLEQRAEASFEGLLGVLPGVAHAPLRDAQRHLWHLGRRASAAVRDLNVP